MAGPTGSIPKWGRVQFCTITLEDLVLKFWSLLRLETGEDLTILFDSGAELTTPLTNLLSDTTFCKFRLKYLN